MLPDTKIKTYKLLFVDREGRKPILITERKAEILQRFLNDRSSQYIDLTDDDGNYSETIQKRLIKGIQKADEENRGGVWICDCGKRVPLGIHTCGCDRVEWLKKIANNK